MNSCGQTGDDLCARALIDARADLEATGNDSRTALIFACEQGHERCVKALAAAKADLEAALPSGATALILSCQKGHEGCVQALVAAKANVDATKNDGSTALMKACAKSHELCARVLIEAGARRDIKNNAGDTVLSLVKKGMAGAHLGVFCDRSGMNPIVGNRFTMKGYDLCEAEFIKLAADERRMYECMPPLPPPAGLAVICTALEE